MLHIEQVAGATQKKNASIVTSTSIMPVYEFHVEMTCAGCSGAVERVLGKLKEKVAKVEIDLDNKKVFVTSTVPADELLETIKKTGKEASYVGVKD